MNCSLAAFQLTGESLGVPSSRTEDALQDTQVTSNPLALSEAAVCIVPFVVNQFLFRHYIKAKESMVSNASILDDWSDSSGSLSTVTRLLIFDNAANDPCLTNLVHTLLAMNTHINTAFRIWMAQLKEVRGTRPLWPELLGATLDAEFQRQRECSGCYSGDVFKDRDDHALEDGEREERLVARLYRAALANDGLVSLQSEPVWLLGYQWPNQGGAEEKSRRADLVGMNSDGALVLFEAKRSVGDPPLIAILEGLDYLSCLLRTANFAKIKSGFEKWRNKENKSVPAGFETTEPNISARPTLVLLAPNNYFMGRQSRSIRGKNWPNIAAIADTFMPSVRLKFATTDFKSTDLLKP